jgi:NAD(P)H-hydrate repair Nnr-like enzyme with NAD(P)H-hydrate dehydratase domain
MKGAPTQIIDGETVYENTTGNAALATAGTGDVLTGMITSLLAQSMNLLVLQFWCVSSRINR